MKKGSINYNIGRNIYDNFSSKDNIEIINLNSNKYKQYIPGGDNLYSQYREGKKTLIVGGVKRGGIKFQSCKPSAHFQLPLVSGCMGQCEYCYLNTRLGGISPLLEYM